MFPLDRRRVLVDLEVEETGRATYVPSLVLVYMLLIKWFKAEPESPTFEYDPDTVPKAYGKVEHSQRSRKYISTSAARRQIRLGHLQISMSPSTLILLQQAPTATAGLLHHADRRNCLYIT